MKFSVLMSVYDKDNEEYFRDALDSILVHQSLLPNQVIIVVDGPIKKKLQDVINEYKIRFSILEVIYVKENKGLGNALSVGLNKCVYDLVARMDADDLSNVDRFQKQIEHFKNNPQIDVLGGNISEFFDSPEEVIFTRKVPTCNIDIVNRGKRRNPMNHVTVMFKRESVIKAGGYLRLLFLEDYYLWVRMISIGMIFENLDEILVNVRTGESMFSRRSNLKVIAGWRTIQNVLVNAGINSCLDAHLNMIAISLFTFVPPKLKYFVYKVFLRN